MGFQPGDRVQLISGGPVMTVEKLGPHPHTNEDVVWCTWFEKAGNRQELHKEHFNPATLRKWEPPGPMRVVRA